MFEEPSGKAAAELAAAKRLMAVAETAAMAAEQEAAAASLAAQDAAAAKALADQELAEELARIRLQSPAVFSPEKAGLGSPAGGKSRTKASGSDDMNLGGALDRDYRDAELSSLPKRSIKDIKRADREREAKKAAQAAARTATSTPAKPADSSLSSPAKPPLPAPTVPADAFHITQAKKAQQIKTPTRNRFNLQGNVVENKASAKIEGSHFMNDSFEMGSAIECKRVTQGAKTVGHWGVQGTVTKTDYMLDHAVQSTKVNGGAVLLAPKSATHVGVAAKIPLQDKLLTTYKEQQEAIREGDTPTMLPVPLVEPDDFLSSHMRHAAALAAEAHKQELPRSKGGVYPAPLDGASDDPDFLTPRTAAPTKVDSTPLTPASAVIEQVMAPPSDVKLPPPPKLSSLW